MATIRSVPKLRIAAVVLAAALLALPAAVHAKLPSSIETTVAPGGNSTVSSPTLSPTMTSMTVDVVPASKDDAFFADMQVVLSMQPSPGKRLLMCIGLYINVAHGIDESVDLQFPETVHPLALLLLSACLEQAAAIDRAAQQAKGAATTVGAAARAAKCPQLATQVGATFTRVGKQYKGTISGTPTKLTQRGRLKVTCTRKGKGMTLKLRPRAKGKSLRSVVGPRLQVGLYNPLDAAGSGTAKLTFRR